MKILKKTIIISGFLLVQLCLANNYEYIATSINDSWRCKLVDNYLWSVSLGSGVTCLNIEDRTVQTWNTYNSDIHSNATRNLSILIDQTVIVAGEKFISAYRGDEWTNYSSLNVPAFSSVNFTDATMGLEGHIVAGTYGQGIFMYDGTGWQNFNSVNTPALSSDLILGVHALADSSVWFRTGQGLLSYKNGNFHEINFGQLGSHIYFDLIQDDDGVIWVLDDSFLYSIVGDSIHQVPNLVPSEERDIYWEMELDSNGNLWVVDSKMLFTLTEEGLDIVDTILADGLRSRIINSFVVSDSLQMVFATNNGWVNYSNNDSEWFLITDIPTSSNSVMFMENNPDGELIIATNHELAIYSDGQQDWVFSALLPGSTYGISTQMQLDFNSSYAVVYSDGFGLAVINRLDSSWTILNDSLDENTAYDVTMDNQQGVWLATDQSLIRYYENTIEVIQYVDDLNFELGGPGFPRLLHTDEHIWLTYGSNICRIDINSWNVMYPADLGIHEDTYLASTVTDDNRILVSGSTFIQAWDGTSWTIFANIPGVYRFAIFEEDIWMYRTGEYFNFNEGEFVSYTETNSDFSFPEGLFRSYIAMGSQGSLWTANNKQRYGYVIFHPGTQSSLFGDSPFNESNTGLYEARTFPNPFNPSTTIEYDLPVHSDVSLIVYDIAGRDIQTLVSRPQTVGTYNVTWDGTNRDGQQVAGGMYFARLQAGEHSSVVKMVYLR